MKRMGSRSVAMLDGVRAKVRAGALAGLLGGLLMAVVALRLALASAPASWAPLRQIAASLLGDAALEGSFGVVLFGFVIHIATSVLWGVAFAALVPARISALAALGLGLAASMVIFAVMTFAVLPALNPQMYTDVIEALPAWLVAHLAYGLGLAAAPWLGRRRRRAPPPADAEEELRFSRRADVR